MKYLGVLAGLVFAAVSAKADPIVYVFDQTIRVGGNGTMVTGTLTTDGRLGTISSADITGYDLTFVDTNAGHRVSFHANPSDGFFADKGGLSATARNLLFNFSGTAGADQFAIYTPRSAYDFESGLEFFSGPLVQVSLFRTGTQVIASAASAATPEPEGLVLLGTGILGLVGVMRRRSIR